MDQINFCTQEDTIFDIIKYISNIHFKFEFGFGPLIFFTEMSFFSSLFFLQNKNGLDDNSLTEQWIVIINGNTNESS
jgi:hypothetical protein